MRQAVPPDLLRILNQFVFGVVDTSVEMMSAAKIVIVARSSSNAGLPACMTGVELVMRMRGGADTGHLAKNDCAECCKTTGLVFSHISERIIKVCEHLPGKQVAMIATAVSTIETVQVNIVSFLLE